MALAIDGSSPASWNLTHQVADGDDIAGTSAAFVPPDGSLLVVCSLSDTAGLISPTISISGGSLAWDQRVYRGDAEGTAGVVVIHTAPVVTGASMTVAITHNDVGVSRSSGTVAGWAMCFVVTGQHASPIGNVGENSATTNNWTPSGIITTSADNSLVFAVGGDWQALGAPTSSDLTETAFHANLIYSGLIGYKSVASAGSQSINFDAAGSSVADWNAVALEILAAAGGGATFNRIIPQLMMVGVGT